MAAQSACSPGSADRRTVPRAGRTLLAVALAAGMSVATARGEDVCPPAILQWFEASYDTIERRTADLFMAGYGAVWLPPPGRADQGNWSVGYDPYDRFDLGGPRRETMYGTETGLKTVARTFDRAGVALHVDAVINHAGFSDLEQPEGFVEAGGYPGLAITLPYDGAGDFHPADWHGDIYGRLAGLVDIAHEKNHRFIRHPVDPGDPDNIPVVGTVPDAAGRLANVPDPSNRRFYPDRDLDPIWVYDPATGQGDIPIYPFNLDDPMAGDPVKENGMGYLMRYLQWMVQEVGVDGFRIDAAKHVEGWVLDYFDRAVYRQNPRRRLDGSRDHVFSYCEVFDGDRGYLNTFVKKTIDPSQPGVIGGNRDVLDFPLQFALRGNLTGNGYVNDWGNVVGAGMDTYGGGLHNGSKGVMFASSHDEHGPELSNVAHAYILMHPGNAVVYFNGKEFGDDRDFPKDGRGDALGGVFGDWIRRLVQIRNTHGRGNYRERLLEKEIHAFERGGSAIVLLSNRTDAGFDSRRFQTTFGAGTPLIELTGAASDPGIDPRDDIRSLLVVNGDGTVDVRFLRNSSFDRNMNSFFHGTGALVYGLSGPQAPAGLELTGTAGVLGGGDPGPNGHDNGVTRLTDLHVVTGESVTARLQTVEVNLLGSHRDVWADGDNALIRVDGGIDVNGNGRVDFTAPGTVSYGFERFGDKCEPLIGPGGLGDGGWDGDGEFVQTIDTTGLAEGTHYIEARAFRHRTDGGPAIYSSFKKIIYVDRLPPSSAVEGFVPFANAPADPDNQDLLVRSLDRTADAVHVFLDEPAGTPDANMIQYAAGGQGPAEKIDRDLFVYGFFGLTSGNHVATVVTFEVTGNVNVQRFAGLTLATNIGRGPGDLDFDGQLTPTDLANADGAFEQILWSRDFLFNPAADVTGDGRVNTDDLLGMEQVLIDGSAPPTVMATYQTVKRRRVDFNGDSLNNEADYAALRAGFDGNDWRLDLNGDAVVNPLDEFLMTARFGVSGQALTSWQAGSGDWSDGNHWTAGVPAAATGAFIDNGGVAALGAGADVTAGSVYVATTAAGRLDVGDAALRTGDLHVGPGGSIAAAPGGQFRLTGHFYNLSTQPQQFDLADATLRFAGSADQDGPQMLEAAGLDLGAIADGWVDNYELGSLVIEPGAVVKLTDHFANHGGAPGGEAVYVDELLLPDPDAGSPDGEGWIDTNGIALYYRNGGEPKRLVYGDTNLDGDLDVDDYLALKRGFGTQSGAIWSGADTDGDGDVDFSDYATMRDGFGRPATTPPALPEPGTLTLFAAAALLLLRRARAGRPPASRAAASATAQPGGNGRLIA